MRFPEILDRIERMSSAAMFAVLAAEQRHLRHFDAPAQKVASRIEAIQIFMRMNCKGAEDCPEELVSMRRVEADCNADVLVALEARVAAIEERLGIAQPDAATRRTSSW